MGHTGIIHHSPVLSQTGCFDRPPGLRLRSVQVVATSRFVPWLCTGRFDKEMIVGEQDMELQRQVQQAVARLQTMEGQLRSTQADVQGLPFLARGFVERDISSSTGRSFAEWIATSVRLRQALEPLAGTSGAAAPGAIRRTIGDELPRLAKLRAYLQKAPEKVNMVPSGLLKPQQRGQVLGQVQQQVAELQALEGELAAIADRLPGAG